MNEMQRMRLRMEAAEEFVRGATYTLGLFPIAYALVLTLGSSGVWDTNVHRTVASFPGAPYSWAVISLVLGVWLFGSQKVHSHFGIKWSGIALSVWCMWLVIAFTISSVQSSDWTGALAICIYSTFATLYTLRVRMAEVWMK